MSRIVIGLTVVAFGTSAPEMLVSGIAAIRLFLRLLETRGFHAFAYYLVFAGAGLLLYLAVG